MRVRGLRASWPLLILDHAGEAHEVAVGEGETFLYESARLLHGRPAPLDGEGAAHLFLHYVPRDEAAWPFRWIARKFNRPVPLRDQPDARCAERLAARASVLEAPGVCESDHRALLNQKQCAASCAHAAADAQLER